MRTSFVKALILALILLSSNAILTAQDGASSISRYRWWGIFGGPLVFMPAEIHPDAGKYIPDSHPIISYSAGLDFRLINFDKFYLSTGLYVTGEPVYKISFKIDPEDLYTSHGALEDKSSMFAMNSISVPFKLHWLLLVKKDFEVMGFAGVNARYLPPGEGEMVYAIHNEDLTEGREVFGIRANSSNQFFHGSMLFGAGLALPGKKVMWSADLVCSINFKSLMMGEYLFDNLLVSPSSRGRYELSGNYIGLMIRMNLSREKIYIGI